MLGPDHSATSTNLHTNFTSDCTVSEAEPASICSLTLMRFTYSRSPEEGRHRLSPLVDPTSDDIVLSRRSKTLWPVFALFVVTSGFHRKLYFSTSLRKGSCSLEGSWCVAVLCSTNERSPNVAIADFAAMPHSFSTTLQPLTPASSQQQRWSFQCHVYSERLLLHLAGKFNALSLRKKVSKGDRLFIGGSRLYVFFF